MRLNNCGLPATTLAGVGRTANADQAADVGMSGEYLAMFARELGSRNSRALAVVGARGNQQVFDFMVVREGLEPSTSAL